MILRHMVLLLRIFFGVACVTTSTFVFAVDTVKVDNFGDSAKQVYTEKITTPLLSQGKDVHQKVTDWRIEDRTMATPSNALIADTQVISKLPNKPVNFSTNLLNKAYQLSGQAMKQGLPLEGDSSNPNPLPSKIDLYKDYVGYFDANGRGNALKLGGLNIANILQRDVIPEDDTISKNVINLLIDPYPEKIIAVPTKSSSIAEKEAFAQKLTNQALLSVPMNALAEIIARRIPTGGDNPKSNMQIMRSQCEGRITDPNWPASLIDKSPEALLRELAYMQAFQLYMEYQQYRLNEQAVSLLAINTATQAKLGPLAAELYKQINQAKAMR